MAPSLLISTIDTASFDCGKDSLNYWFHKQSLRNQQNGSSRVFVVLDEEGRVAGYYSLSPGSIQRVDVTRNLARNSPDPIPIIVLGRLAVDIRYHRQGIGAGLLKDAILRTLKASQDIGGKCLVVHALDEEAKNFYLQYGFVESPTNPMTLMLPTAAMQKALG